MISTEATNRNTAITAATNALIGAAPGALDTLNELAAAIADDASFSTTILNLISTLQTQVDANETALNDKADLADVDNIQTVSVNAAVVLDDTAFGKIHELTNNGGVTDYTVTLAAPSVGNSGKTVFFKGLHTLTKVVTLSNGAITIDGEANWKLSKRGLLGLKSNGANYTVIAEGSSLLIHTVTYGGFTTPPVNPMVYARQGQLCFMSLVTTPTTSTATTFTITAPFNIQSGRWLIKISNATGAYTTGTLTSDGTNVLSAFTTPAAGAWTASGTKAIEFTITAIIAN